MIYSKSSARSMLFKVFMVAFALVTLSGCEAFENQLKADRGGGMEKQDYRDGLAPRDLEFESDKNASSDIPALQPYIASGTTEYESYPLVSVSVNRSVPLRDIFYQLAQQSDYDIELDPRIVGSIIFSANQRPLDQVVERICNMTGLRYKIKDRVMRVELDTPYNKVYKVDYLNHIRRNASTISTSVSVVSGTSGDSGSSFKNDSESEVDFWGELEQNLSLILNNASDRSLKTQFDPKVSVIEQNVNLQPVGIPDKDGRITVSPPDAILNIESIPAVETSSEKGSDGEGDSAKFVMNKQAGLITVFANEFVQKQIEDYLTKLKRATTSQVLVEAKILEVSLDDAYSAGIDWRAIDLSSGEVVLNYLTENGPNLLGTAAASSTGGPSINSLPPGNTTSNSGFVMGYAGNDIQALVRAVSEYGTVKALASPRMTVLNNQAAILNVATNRVFFEIDIDVTNDSGVTQTEIQSDIRNVPEGVLVNVQPSINLDDNTISMAIRPTITRVTREVSDPGVQFVTAENNIEGVFNNIPELNVQEIDSVIKMRSGQPVVMGGLLQDLTTASEDGVPVLNELPLIGGLFKSKTDNIHKSELVIFLKATILDDPSDSIDDADRDLYRQFSDDRRPLKL